MNLVEPYAGCPSCLCIYESDECAACPTCRTFLVPREQMPNTPTPAPTVESVYFGKQQAELPGIGFLLGCRALDLANLGEPVLTNVKQTPAYRLVWERSFHGTAVIRAETHESGLLVFASNSQGPRADTVLGPDAGVRLREAIEGSGFWRMPLTDPLDVRGLDGSSWFLEGFDGERHHLVERWSILDDPDERGLSGYRALCLTLLELSKLELSDMY